MPSVQDWDISCSTELCFPQSLHQKWYSCLNSGGKKEAQRKGSKEHWVWVRSAYNSVEPSSRLSSAHIWLYQLLVCASGPGGVPAQTGGLCCCYHFCDGAVFAWCLFLSFAGQKVICWHGGVCFELAYWLSSPKTRGCVLFPPGQWKGQEGAVLELAAHFTPFSSFGLQILLLQQDAGLFTASWHCGLFWR